MRAVRCAVVVDISRRRGGGSISLETAALLRPESEYKPSQRSAHDAGKIMSIVEVHIMNIIRVYCGGDIITRPEDFLYTSL